MTKQLRCPLVTSEPVLSGSVHEACTEKASPALFCPSQAELGVAALPVVLLLCILLVVQSSSLSQFLQLFIEETSAHTHIDTWLYCAW